MAFSIYFFFLLVLLSLTTGHVLRAQSHEHADDWYRQSYRKLFFDYHTYQAALNVASQFDADHWAAQLEKTHVQAVSLHAYCNYGWRYYRKGKTGYVHPGLPEGLDLVEEVMQACHERGIRVIAYFNVHGGEAMDQYHPEWISTRANGERRKGVVSLFSPYFEEFLLPLLEEFSNNYQVDGVFFDFLRIDNPDDQHARKQFVLQTGKTYPDSPESNSWREYIQWLLAEGKRKRMQAMEALHKGNPDVLVAFNWSYNFLQPEVPPDQVGFLSMDIEPEDQVFEASFIGKYWATFGKPFDIMNSAFLQWWGDWGVKPAVTMKQECAAVMANGGRTWIGYQIRPEYFVEEALMNEFRKTFEFVKEREDLCKEMVPVPNIAILHSSSIHYKSDPVLAFYNSGLISLRGACKMLMELGQPFHILNEEVLLENLERYRIVILPDQRYIGEQLADALRVFVERGGRLIGTVRTATQDEDYRSTGKYLLGDVFGVKLVGEYGYDHSYIELKEPGLKKDVLGMAQQAYGDCALMEAGSARVLADLWEPLLLKDGRYVHLSSPPGKYTGHPAITLNHYGKGQAVFLSNDIFYAYAHRSQWNLKNLFGNILTMIDPEKLIAVEAPGMVEVVLNRMGPAIQIHLVNHYREKALEGAITLVEEMVPVCNIGISLKKEKEPVSITLQPEGTELQWSYRDGYVNFRVPKLEIYSIVEVR
jgi:hypothetical protein